MRLRFDRRHACERRARAQFPFQCAELVPCTLGHTLHVSIRQIANPAVDSQPDGGSVHEVAKADALHAAGDDEAQGRHESQSPREKRHVSKFIAACAGPKIGSGPVELFSIIIDRVGSTNVFNIIQGSLPSRDTHLQTIVDDDLIEEFLGELERLSRISNSLTIHTTRAAPVDVADELRRVGETFFLQFFPEPLQDRLTHMESGFLFLHVDHRLRRIPWELLHDGRTHLAQKFFMGKNVSGVWKDIERPIRDRLRVLIIADPTEDLEWARREGEGLFESLNAEQSADRVDVQLLSGRRITKLGLLNAIKDRDIIHFCGHLFHGNQPQESGWLLADEKVLRAREIEKAGLSPHLVFSNSCLSSPVAGPAEGGEDPRFSDLAGAFLKANIGSYIGTNWEITDSNHTLDFAMDFYRAIFEEKSVGEALFEARRLSRRERPAYDLTWANYVLHGNPMSQVYHSAGRPTFDASRNELNQQRILESYPSPVASSYGAFLEASEETTPAGARLRLLVDAFEKTVFTVGSLVFANYHQLKLKGALPTEESPVNTRAWLESLFGCVRGMRHLSYELAAPGLLESLSLHQESLHKLLAWAERSAAEVDPEGQEILLVTFQYLFDNILSDLAVLGRHRFLYVFPNGEDAVVLQGPGHDSILLMTDGGQSNLLEQIERNRGRVCFWNSSRNQILSLHEFMRYDVAMQEVAFVATVGRRPSPAAESGRDST